MTEEEKAARKAFVDGVRWAVAELLALGAIQKRLARSLVKDAEFLMEPGALSMLLSQTEPHVED